MSLSRPNPTEQAAGEDGLGAVKSALGQRIKELRALHGITQDELAERSALFRTYMSRIESGRANPTLAMLYQIANAFGLEIKELLVPAIAVPPARVKSVIPAASRGRVRK